jgi:hypothetical protein
VASLPGIRQLVRVRCKDTPAVVAALSGQRVLMSGQPALSSEEFRGAFSPVARIHPFKWSSNT